MGSQGRNHPPEPDIKPLLNASQYFLCHRNFDHCKKYAVKAREADPNHRGPAQLLAIAAVLSVSPSGTGPELPDWYRILGLPRLTSDPDLIRARLKWLANVLNPERNPYPFAAAAREWVFKAGSFLSNPNLKSQFDEDLSRQDVAGNGGESFWTVCPYCYFMYEYERIFEELVLKCQNEKCGRAFTAVAVAASAVPPPEVVDQGKYICGGFLPLDTVDAKNGQDGSWKWWAPFMLWGSNPGRDDEDVKKVRRNEGSKSKSEKNDDLLEISDDEMAGEEGVKEGVDGNGGNGGKVVLKRRKMAAKGRKKVMGKGIKVKWNFSPPSESGEGMEQKINRNIDGAEASKEMEEVSNGDGLEFLATDDDILVALESQNDLGV